MALKFNSGIERLATQYVAAVTQDAASAIPVDVARSFTTETDEPTTTDNRGAVSYAQTQEAPDIASDESEGYHEVERAEAAIRDAINSIKRRAVNGELDSAQQQLIADLDTMRNSLGKGNSAAANLVIIMAGQVSANTTPTQGQAEAILSVNYERSYAQLEFDQEQLRLQEEREALARDMRIATGGALLEAGEEELAAAILDNPYTDLNEMAQADAALDAATENLQNALASNNPAEIRQARSEFEARFTDKYTLSGQSHRYDEATSQITTEILLQEALDIAIEKRLERGDDISDLQALREKDGLLTTEDIAPHLRALVEQGVMSQASENQVLNLARQTEKQAQLAEESGRANRNDFNATIASSYVNKILEADEIVAQAEARVRDAEERNAPEEAAAARERAQAARREAEEAKQQAAEERQRHQETYERGMDEGTRTGIARIRQALEARGAPKERIERAIERYQLRQERREAKQQQERASLANEPVVHATQEEEAAAEVATSAGPGAGIPPDAQEQAKAAVANINIGKLKEADGAEITDSTKTSAVAQAKAVEKREAAEQDTGPTV